MSYALNDQLGVFQMILKMRSSPREENTLTTALLISHM